MLSEEVTKTGPNLMIYVTWDEPAHHYTTYLVFEEIWELHLYLILHNIYTVYMCEILT